MTKATRGFVRALVGLVALLAAGYAGWRWGDAVFPALERRVGFGESEVEVGEQAPSEALGRAAEARVELFLADGSPELELSGAEVTSLLRHSRAGLLPQQLHEPRIVLMDGRARAAAEVAVADFPRLPELGPVGSILPDTVTLRMEGSVMGFGDRHAVLFAQRIEVAGVPLPRRLIPQVLTALGRSDRPGLPGEAVAIVLPEGIASVYVVGDRLVLVADS